MFPGRCSREVVLDGLCSPKLKSEQLFVFDVPLDVAITQSVIVLDPQGHRTTTTMCTPRSL